MNKYYWKSICKENRQDVISNINIVISKYVSFLNFQQSSDLSLGFLIEAEDCKAEGLFAELSKTLKSDNTDIDPVNAAEYSSAPKTQRRPRNGNWNVSSIHGIVDNGLSGL